MESYEETAGELPGAPPDVAMRLPPHAITHLREDGQTAGGPYQPPAEHEGALGYTMFDTPHSEDDALLVLLPKDSIGALPSQAGVRIKSGCGRAYLGIVVRGPFALPDGLRADAPPVVATAIRGGFFLPEYHGLVQVEIAGEEKNGQLHPHRFRPRPNSPVFALSEAEVQAFLKTGGNIHLGQAFGHENLPIAFPSTAKEVLPRHTGILGTTGGGKSTTVANLVAQLQQAGVATILLDTEGEYTEINEPTNDPKMIEILAEMGRKPQGVANTHLYYPIGRQSANPLHPNRRPFSPSFENISPTPRWRFST